MKELSAIVRALVSNDTGTGTLATLVTVEGSSYRRPGARLLVLGNGTKIGSVSGGCLEEDVLTRAERVTETGKPDVAVYDTTSENDLVWGVGLGCHGVVKVLIEPLPARPSWAMEVDRKFRNREAAVLAVVHDASVGRPLGTTIGAEEAQSTRGCFVQRIRPPTKLAIFGAGNDAGSLVRLAKELGWVVSVSDPRPAYANAGRFPEADAVIAGPVDELPRRADLDENSVGVIMTHHYVYDVPLLRELLKSPAGYIGLLGPRKRAEKIVSDLASEGVTLSAQQRSRLHAPVGLDLGADGSEQVALAIIAEIQATLNGHDAKPLRHRRRPIHE